MQRPRRKRESAFDFAAEVEGLGIGIYEFVGRVSRTARVSILCPRRFRYLYLLDRRVEPGQHRWIAREIPYFLVAYGLTIALVALIDSLLPVIGEGSKVDDEGAELRNLIRERLLDLDPLTWSLVIIPVLISLHYGIMIFDAIVSGKQPGPRQRYYDTASVILIYFSNNILIPTVALMLFMLCMPLTERYDDHEVGVLMLTALVVMVLTLAVLAAAPVLIVLNTISFIRVLAPVYGVGKLRFARRVVLATLPLIPIGLAVFVLVEALFVVLAKDPPAAG